MLPFTNTTAFLLLISKLVLCRIEYLFSCIRFLILSVWTGILWEYYWAICKQNQVQKVFSLFKSQFYAITQNKEEDSCMYWYISKIFMHNIFLRVTKSGSLFIQNTELSITIIKAVKLQNIAHIKCICNKDNNCVNRAFINCKKR